MVQDIMVYVSLDTKATPKETLVPLILSLEGEAAYKEYRTYTEFTTDFAAETAANKAAKALWDQMAVGSEAMEKVAALGLAQDSDGSAITDALDTLRDSHDDWYYLIPAGATDEQITALAAWAEATVLPEQALAEGAKEAEKLLVAQTATSSLALHNAQTVICYNPDAENTCMHAAWVGRMVGYYPKSVTWKWKALQGIAPVDVDAAALGMLLENNVNTYVNNHKRDYMRDGTCADGEYIDVVIARWQIKQGMRQALTDLFVDTDTIPYDDTGFTMVGAVIIQALNQAAENGIIRSIDQVPQFSVAIPRYMDATEEQIAERRMPDIMWSATLLGGVHGIKVNGRLSIHLSSEEG